jgi:hypothetical protein
VAGQPRPQTRDSLAGRCPLFQGTILFYAVVPRVEVTQVVVTQGLHRFVYGRGDDHLYNIAVLGRVHFHRGGAGAAAAPARGPPGPRTRMGVVPEQGPGIHMGMAMLSTTRCSVAIRWGHFGW